MNIWIIQTGYSLPINPDIRQMRPGILADKLIDKGHTVLWWGNAFDHLRKKWVFENDTLLEIKNGLSIYALKGIAYKKNISILRFISNRLVVRKFRKLAPKMSKPDIILSSTPPHDLAYEAAVFSKNNNIPFLISIEDRWPDFFLLHVPKKLKKLAKLVLYKEFRMIRDAMKMADGILACSNTFLNWGLNYAERNKSMFDKVFYLGAARSSKLKRKSKKITELSTKMKNNFVVTFIGTFAHYHSPEILVDCAKKLAKKNILFVLVGDGELYNKIHERASSVSNIVLTGWLNQDEITTVLTHSNIGICPTSFEIDLFPNKAFAYLSVGLPIISSFQGDLMEIIEQYQIGFNYPRNDVSALAKSIMRLYNDKNLYTTFYGNAQKAFDEIFDSDIIYENFSDHIKNVEKIFNPTTTHS